MRTLFLTALLLLSNLAYSDISARVDRIFQEELAQYRNIVDVTASNASEYAKLSVSFHQSRLAADPNEFTLTLNVSNQQIAYLKSKGFTVTKNTYWLEQRKNQINRWSKTTLNSGIPGFPCYLTVEETYAEAQQLVANNPTLAEWIDIGDSWNKANGRQGYDLFVLKISNQEIEEEKPILLVHSAMHAREYTPAAVNLEFAKFLLNNYQNNADAHWLVNHHEIHVILHLNPDGRKLAEQGLLWRKNTNENACVGPNQGVDLNRNFAYSWNITNGEGSSGNACAATYRGAFAESEPETQALSNYIRQTFPDRRGDSISSAAPNDTMGMHIDLHSFSELVLWPWGDTDRPAPNGDALQTLGRKIAWFNGYTPQQSIGLYPTDGTSDDPSYAELGVAALTFELGTAFFQSCSVYENEIRDNNLEALVYAAKASRAPYLLPAGPDVITLSANQSYRPAIRAGDALTLNIEASDERLNQTNGQESTHSIASVAITVDETPWNSMNSSFATPSDGTANSSVEDFTLELDTSNWTEGTHIIYATATDQAAQTGVPTAIFVDVGDNQSPTAEFSYQCDGLACSFDATASRDDQGIVEYQWQTNGLEFQSANLEYSFSRAGLYRVTLIVTDAQDYSSYTEKVVAVEAEAAIVSQTNSSSGGSMLWFFALVAILRLRTTRAY